MLQSRLQFETLFDARLLRPYRKSSHFQSSRDPARLRAQSLAGDCRARFQPPDIPDVSSAPASFPLRAPRYIDGRPLISTGLPLPHLNLRLLQS